MVLVRNGDVAQDNWVFLQDDDPLPANGNVIVCLARLNRDADALMDRAGRVGVELANTYDARELAAHIALLDLIVLDFPAFTDGRAYSQARVIRTELGFKGELRATGDVLPDQAQFMARVGFDSFEIAENRSLETWQRVSRTISHSYQANYGLSGLKRRGAKDARH